MNVPHPIALNAQYMRYGRDAVNRHHENNAGFSDGEDHPICFKHIMRATLSYNASATRGGGFQVESSSACHGERKLGNAPLPSSLLVRPIKCRIVTILA